MRANTSWTSSRAGLTLVEVCLVLAILVVIGSITMPAMEGAFRRQALNSAGDLVRGAWAKARLAAMQSGQAHVFRYEPAGSRFQIVAMNTLGLPESGELAPDTAAKHGPVDMLRISRNRLPDGIIFAAGEAANSNQLLATLPDSAGGPWSAPVLFHPDGTTSDASVLLSNARKQSIRVTLRGLTGISNTSEVTREAPQ